MPSTSNINRFRITSNNQNYTGTFYNDQVSGIDLHGQTSMEVSIQKAIFSYYSPTENDFTILCDTNTAGSNIDIDLSTLSSTCKNGKMLAIKKLSDGNTFSVNILSATIDGNTSYSFSSDYQGIIIVYDKTINEWYVIGNI